MRAPRHAFALTHRQPHVLRINQVLAIRCGNGRTCADVEFKYIDFFVMRIYQKIISEIISQVFLRKAYLLLRRSKGY